jgi:phosphatidylglycerol lysyltransferase
MCLPYGTVPFTHLLAVFVLALVAGFISHVPGGLGVFDTIVLVGLGDHLPGNAILAALLIFRIVYFLIPVLVAGALFGTVEALTARHHLARLTDAVGGVVAPAAPLVLAGCAFAGGVVLLFANAVPVARAQLRLVASVLPLSVLEASHFLGSVAGVLLLLLARGLQRRLHTAWVLAVPLLALGAISMILKGLDWQEAVALAVLFLILLAGKGEFHRDSSLLRERYTPGWFLAIAVVLISAFWLGLFSYKHDEFDQQLWWRFALHGDASRFLRASVAVAVIALAAAMFRLLTPVRDAIHRHHEHHAAEK